MKITFLIPPCFTPGEAPAERSAGCTRIVYPFPNLYELSAAAVVRQVPDTDVRLEDFVYPERSPREFQDFIAADNSDTYIIWGVNLSIPDDAKALEIIRQAHPDANTILLGPSGTFFPEKLFAADPRLVIVRGEPEVTLKALVQALVDGESYEDLPGLTLMRDGKVKRNPAAPLLKDLDALPYPARDLLGGREYHNPKLKVAPYTTMLTSRNCPFRCIYCVPSSLTFARELDYRHDHHVKPQISFRSVQSVEQELDMLANQGYKAIGFVDDNFIWDLKRTEGICAALRKHGMVWGCQARADAITEPIARELGRSGCRYVDLGIESLDDRILEYVRKGITTEQIYRAVELLQKYNVPVKLNILIGTSPLETEQSIRDTIKKAKKMHVDQVMINIISPFPGTEFYDTALKNGWIEGNEYRPTNVQRESILNYPHLSARQMERILFRSNLDFFTDPRFIWKQMRRFRSAKEFFVALKALKRKLFG